MPAKPSRKSRFERAEAPTAPTADRGSGTAPVARRAVPVKPAGTAEPKRSAFTWRRTPAEAMAMDHLALELKRELGLARLGHAEILAALVDLAGENPAVFGALAAKLQSGA